MPHMFCDKTLFMDLSAYLNAKGETASSFAAKLETSRQNVSRWCDGVMPRKPDLAKIMAATNGAVTPMDFAFAKPRSAQPEPSEHEGQVAR